MLNQLTTAIDKSRAILYRGNGLAAVNNANGPKIHRTNNNVIALFNEEEPSITIKINFIETDFLDGTFNRLTKKYFPIPKAKNTPLYTNSFSNHPLTIIKQLLKMVNKRILDLSCNKEELETVKYVYKTALKGSGYFSSMSYNNSNTQYDQTN